MKNHEPKIALRMIYAKLYKEFGPQHWWPARTKFEVIVGAILTQNTNWGNVEKAIQRLKAAGALSERVLRDIPVTKLAALIKPAGYFNVKARRLKNFMRFFFDEYQGDLNAMGRPEALLPQGAYRRGEEELSHLRHKLLKVNGIGPETADSILLYALDKPVFVVDAYTKRFLYRHNLIGQKAEYHQIQELFTAHFDEDVHFFQEYHALIVALGKNYCKPKPLCGRCPLNRIRYSLTSKCNSCHRALLSREGRMTTRSGFICSDCGGEMNQSTPGVSGGHPRRRIPKTIAEAGEVFTKDIREARGIRLPHNLSNHQRLFHPAQCQASRSRLKKPLNFESLRKKT